MRYIIPITGEAAMVKIAVKKAITTAITHPARKYPKIVSRIVIIPISLWLNITAKVYVSIP